MLSDVMRAMKTNVREMRFLPNQNDVTLLCEQSKESTNVIASMKENGFGKS